jgi:hypothetical protein
MSATPEAADEVGMVIPAQACRSQVNASQIAQTCFQSLGGNLQPKLWKQV